MPETKRVNLVKKTSRDSKLMSPVMFPEGHYLHVLTASFINDTVSSWSEQLCFLTAQTGKSSVDAV